MYYKTAASMSNCVRNYPSVQDQFHCLHLILTSTCQPSWNFKCHVLYIISKKKL